MSAPAKVLVVDDTPNNVKLLADLLAVKGYAVMTAANGEEALAKVASEMPDLVLLDVMMPGLSGYDVCRRIRTDPSTTLLPVVLVTSLDPAEERVHGIEAGAGLIDQGFRLPVGVLLYNHGGEDFQVRAGDRVAQLCIERYTHPTFVEVEAVEATARGAGWGSSGAS